ncbi:MULTISPECIES: NfeD family protein [Parachlamydia]|jgi:membrane-bound serine protease (ClpP class)|uniref:NfeD integral membrane domain-containing protein n=2 Tax=Parachlamydia acanthamoebae TaxID=83552 RepID=F8L137_PARAV|nr:NfeD family protein [Parachlamydia acanthamoebae]EFB42572.1 hypothetical protein pah_c004o070 [Parachlamydia acanthamoebae str. Hall's coccus]KIA77367.1 hypothetical protein DB43_GL00280 [Parachlamydia acanthamoebae]CCB86956.1 putative uncharacterized protein [Parachlamydia acanthamoebae UV-7]
MISILLLLIGLFLIVLEFYLPGAIMGILGAIAICISIVMFAVSSQSTWESLLFLIGAAALVVGVCKFMLWKIPRSQSGFSIYSDQDQSGYQASTYDSSLLGKRAIAFTDLKPGGLIILEGKRLQAISQSGYLIKGTDVLIIGGEGESLMVKVFNHTPLNPMTHKEV